MSSVYWGEFLIALLPSYKLYISGENIHTPLPKILSSGLSDNFLKSWQFSDNLNNFLNFSNNSNCAKIKHYSANCQTIKKLHLSCLPTSAYSLQNRSICPIFYVIPIIPHYTQIVNKNFAQNFTHNFVHFAYCISIDLCYTYNVRWRRGVPKNTPKRKEDYSSSSFSLWYSSIVS